MIIQEPSAGISSSPPVEGRQHMGHIQSICCQTFDCPFQLLGRLCQWGKPRLNSLSQISFLGNEFSLQGCRKYLDMLKISLKKKKKLHQELWFWPEGIVVLREDEYLGTCLSFLVKHNVQGFFHSFYYILHLNLRIFTQEQSVHLWIFMFCAGEFTECFGAQQHLTPGSSVAFEELYCDNALKMLYFSILAGATEAWNLWFMSAKENCIKWRIWFEKKRSS